MSVREFAAELGYSPRNGHVSVYRLENGDRKPSQQALMLMKQLQGRGVLILCADMIIRA
jgi:DNA-binding transcriptional regulator YiaG